MAFVKRKRMPQRDRPFVVRLLVDQPEKPLAALAVAPVPACQRVAVQYRLGRGQGVHAGGLLRALAGSSRGGVGFQPLRVQGGRKEVPLRAIASVLTKKLQLFECL